MADDRGDAPKKDVDLANLVDGGGATGGLRKQMDRTETLTGGSRALRKALAPLTATQETMEANKAAFCSATIRVRTARQSG